MKESMEKQKNKQDLKAEEHKPEHKVEHKPEHKAERRRERKAEKKWLVLTILGALMAVGGAVCLVMTFLIIHTDVAQVKFPSFPTNDKKEVTYSALTGEPLKDASLVNAPAYCVQTPNGTDGGRPQAGLTQAGVIFEAIAEAGITRFAAIYQNPTSAVIGPVRSLRLYFLQWDTPFDCTIVHAGGARDALQAVKKGYKDLTENYTYMYRGTYRERRWNNLFTTSKYLEQFSKDKNYTTSNIQGFARMTPEESEKARISALAVNKLDITKATAKDTDEVKAAVPKIALNFGGMVNFNVRYTYDAKTNTYLRSYESGLKHEVYECPKESLGEVNPEDKCKLTQMAPKVVVAMIVDEKKASDNYHESITTTGSGKAYIFQNGEAIEGKWSKPAIKDQITFTDSKGNEVKLAPGQTFITAVPKYGSVDF